MCNYILAFKLNFVDFIAGKPYWRFHSTLKTRLYYLMPQWNFLYLAIIQWHGKKLSYIQVNLCQKLFFSLWPVWDIFVQNQYAGENGLNGLLCYQNNILSFKNFWKKCENWQKIFLILLTESQFFWIFFAQY